MSPRARRIRFVGKVENRDAAALLLAKSGDVVLVERGKPRLLVVRCPCGCGDDLLINLDDRAGSAWRCYLNRRGLTIYPSYWRDTGCGSHFIVWDNHIYWCSGWESDESDDWYVTRLTEDAVQAALPADCFVQYEKLAEQLDLIPWEVLQACRQLVRKRLAVAGHGSRKGEFRKASDAESSGSNL